MRQPSLSLQEPSSSELIAKPPSNKRDGSGLGPWALFGRAFQRLSLLSARWGGAANYSAFRPWLIALPMVWLGAWALSPWLGPVQLLAPALTLAVLMPLSLRALDQLAKGRTVARAVRWVEPALVCGGFLLLALVLFPEVFQGKVLLDLADHPVMRARAQLIAQGLAHGKLVRWTHLFQGGDTLVDLYPNLVSYGSALLHLLMPQGTAFAKTYSIFCVLLWSLRGVAVYNICRRFSGPLVSALLSVASLFDLGSEHQDGTWYGYFRLGMVHNNLAITCALFAVAGQIDLCRRVSKGPIVVVLLSTVAAVYGHLLGLLYMTVSLAGLGLAMLARGRVRRPLWALATTAAGLLLIAVWSLPYAYAMQHYGFTGASGGISYAELGKGLLDGSLPISSFAAYYGLVVLAVFAGLGSKQRERVQVSVIVLLFVLLAMSEWLVQNQVLTVLGAYLDGWHRRALTCAKIAALPAVAALLSDAFRKARCRDIRPRTVFVRAVFLALVLSSLGRASYRGALTLKRELLALAPASTFLVKGLPTNGTSQEHLNAFAWVAEQRKHDPSPTPWRMALWGRSLPAGHVHWAWAQGPELGVPVVDYFGWMSANFLTNRPREWSLDCFHAWNIRYIVGPGDQSPIAGATVRFQAGDYRVWEVPGYEEPFVVAPQGVRISNLKLEGDEIWFDVEGASKDTSVRVRTAFYPRWSAEQDGHELALFAEPSRSEAKRHEDQVALRVGNGRVHLRYGAAPPRYGWGLSLSGLGVLASVVLLSDQRRRRLEAALFAARDKVQGWARGAKARWLSRRVLVSGLIALVPALVATGLLAHSRKLLPAPIEGWGMRLSAQHSQDGPLNCRSEISRGEYICELGKVRYAEANAALGHTPVTDDSGEWAKQWVGTRVHLFKAGTTVQVSFSRMSVAGRKLKIKVQSSGDVQLVVRSGAYRSEPQSPSGTSTLEFALPAGLPSELSVELSSARDNGWVVFAGGS